MSDLKIECPKCNHPFELTEALAGPMLSPAARAGAQPAAQNPLVGFQGVPVSSADGIAVPPGYTAEVIYAWGDPIGDSFGAGGLGLTGQGEGGGGRGEGIGLGSIGAHANGAEAYIEFQDYRGWTISRLSSSRAAARATRRA